jgi:S-adenosylmethionine uptake transporter
LIASLVVRKSDYRLMAHRPHAIAIATRSSLILVSWLAYYQASRSLPLAELVTYYFAAPLFVVAMSAPLLREYVGPGRWLATLVGFAGVLIAANPTGASGLTPMTLALTAAVCWALTTILARGLTRAINTPTMMLAGAIGFVVVCGAMLPAIGVWPTLREAALMASIGVIGSMGQYLWFEGMRRAQASLLAPLEYSMLAYAIIWGWLFFGDLPSLRTLIGAGVIVASGALLTTIEIRRRHIVATG